MIFQISRLGSIGSQFKYHWGVYLDDADGFYFGFCEKISKIKKNLPLCPSFVNEKNQKQFKTNVPKQENLDHSV